jgi:GntR family transcriptional regulator, transcriptional repressor for pyruvate dehydrogenase complex
MTSSKPQKTALLVAQSIVADIHERGLRTGDKLPPERVMIEDYTVGRGTLREAYRFLELQGVLRFKPGPGGGPVVAKPGAETLATTLALLLQFDDAPYRTIAEARVAFEPVMARLAATRISPERLGRLQASNDDMAASIKSGEYDVYLRCNEDFHKTIAWSSGNSLFGFLIDTMVGEMDLSGHAQGIEYPLRQRQAVLDAHRGIYEAIAAGDEDRVEAAMRAHIDEYMTFANRKYPEAMDRQITWR